MEGSEPEDFKYNFENEIIKTKQEAGLIAVKMGNTKEEYYEEVDKAKKLSKKFSYKEKEMKKK